MTIAMRLLLKTLRKFKEKIKNLPTKILYDTSDDATNGSAIGIWILWDTSWNFGLKLEFLVWGTLMIGELKLNFGVIYSILWVTTLMVAKYLNYGRTVKPR